MGHVDLPDFAELAALTQAEQEARIQATMLAQLAAARSPQDLARWFTAWRSWIDEAEVKQILTPAQAAFCQGLFDLLADYFKHASGPGAGAP